MTPDGSEQTVSALRVADQDRLDAQRKMVEQLVAGDADNRRKFKTAAGKLGAIRAILDARAFKSDQTYELQCLGIVLGDAFVVELGMEWVMVDDRHGRVPAVRLPGTSIILFTARFSTMEDQLEFTITGDGRGHFGVRGHLMDAAGIGNRLVWSLALDQSHLPRIIASLSAISTRYGVRGRGMSN